VWRDNTIKWRGRAEQIPQSHLRRHFVRTNVRLHEDPDGRVAVRFGPHQLADCAPDGTLASSQEEVLTQEGVLVSLTLSTRPNIAAYLKLIGHCEFNNGRYGRVPPLLSKLSPAA